MMYILAEALIFAIILTPLGYALYRAHRIAMIERMGRQLHSDIVGYVNGRPYRLDNEGNPIYGYQPTDEPAEHNPPQGGSVISPYTGEPTPVLTDARLRMIASLEENGMFSAEKAARFRNAALLHANGAVSHMEDALLFGEDIIATLPETRPTAREASEAMQVMHAALLITDDLPISPYANDEIYEPDKPLYLR